MSAEIQIDLVKKIVSDWANSDECSGVDALVAIMEILEYNPYKETVTTSAGNVGGE